MLVNNGALRRFSQEDENKPNEYMQVRAVVNKLRDATETLARHNCKQ